MHNAPLFNASLICPGLAVVLHYQFEPPCEEEEGEGGGGGGGGGRGDDFCHLAIWQPAFFTPLDVL